MTTEGNMITSAGGGDISKFRQGEEKAFYVEETI